MREERMTKFDFEFKTKLRLEQARFKRRKLELETQMKELETKYQLLEKEHDSKRKVMRTALDNDDFRSNQPVLETNQPSNGPQKERFLRLGR